MKTFYFVVCYFHASRIFPLPFLPEIYAPPHLRSIKYNSMKTLRFLSADYIKRNFKPASDQKRKEEKEDNGKGRTTTFLDIHSIQKPIQNLCQSLFSLRCLLSYLSKFDHLLYENFA
jgi:hypothetical protein